MPIIYNNTPFGLRADVATWAGQQIASQQDAFRAEEERDQLFRSLGIAAGGFGSAIGNYRDRQDSIAAAQQQRDDELSDQAAKRQHDEDMARLRANLAEQAEENKYQRLMQDRTAAGEQFGSAYSRLLGSGEAPTAAPASAPLGQIPMNNGVPTARPLGYTGVGYIPMANGAPNVPPMGLRQPPIYVPGMTAQQQAEAQSGRDAIAQLGRNLDAIPPERWQRFLSEVVATGQHKNLPPAMLTMAMQRAFPAPMTAAQSQSSIDRNRALDIQQSGQAISGRNADIRERELAAREKAPQPLDAGQKEFHRVTIQQLTNKINDLDADIRAERSAQSQLRSVPEARQRVLQDLIGRRQSLQRSLDSAVSEYGEFLTAPREGRYPGEPVTRGEQGAATVSDTDIDALIDQGLSAEEIERRLGGGG